MSHLDKKIFGKKSYSDLLEEIYKNQKNKESQIGALISELKPLIEDIGDATLIVPLIKEYMELGNEENGFGISEAEKDQLLNDIKGLQLPPKKDDK